MKKRGQANLWVLIEAGAVVLMVSIAVGFAISQSKGTIFEKLNIARDISMQINTLSGLPGDGYIVNNNLHGYSLGFFNDKVEVFEDISEEIKGDHSFVAIGSPDFNLVLEEPKRVVIAKVDGNIMISENIPNFS